MYIRLMAFLLISLAIGYFSYGNLNAFTSVEFKEVMGVLLNVSSIIFAIIGAWIAIIYPSAIKSAIIDSRENNVKLIHRAVQDANYLSELFDIVMQSAIIIVFAIFIQVCMPIIKSFDYFGLSISLVKFCAFSFMLFATFVQVNSIISVVLKNYFLLRKVRGQNSNDVADHDI
ncbi:hypothetical protein [Halomonas citrativorans]|uniref:Uncharacterized protein n=1 Tax=Halomonas citrativorans TaxID=2742612 RepID=A0ABR9FGM2_9GAMM|nr:hypothetical protein [Halomonas citrativorans]MBE0405022.1 hypothetical protein [Halomonas citrativorans]